MESLNVDKILNKALTSRQKNVMGKVVRRDQACGVPGRTIFDHLYLIEDLVYRMDDSDQGGALLCWDQKKAFDLLEPCFLHEALESLGFGPPFRRWITCLYTNISSNVKVNGALIDSIPVTRSVKQRGPLSMLLCCLDIEFLGQRIRRNPDIWEISLPNTKEQKIKHYADDTVCLISSPKSYESIGVAFDEFSLASGAKIKEKTESYSLGIWRGNVPGGIPQQLVKHSENSWCYVRTGPTRRIPSGRTDW